MSRKCGKNKRRTSGTSLFFACFMPQRDSRKARAGVVCWLSALNSQRWRREPPLGGSTSPVLGAQAVSPTHRRTTCPPRDICWTPLCTFAHCSGRMIITHLGLGGIETGSELSKRGRSPALLLHTHRSAGVRLRHGRPLRGDVPGWPYRSPPRYNYSPIRTARENSGSWRGK